MRDSFMSRRLSIFSLRVLVIIISSVLALGLGIFVAQIGMSAREFVIFLLVMGAGILVLVPTHTIIRLGFGLWILTFALGWRTIYLTPNLNIHPSEVLAYLLCFMILVNSWTSHKPLELAFPRLAIVFLFFVVLGVFTALGYGYSFDQILEEVKVFVVLIPAYYVVQWQIRSRQDWERVITLVIIVSTYVALLGFVDFFLPSVSTRLAGEAGVDAVALATDLTGNNTFARVLFLIYGSPAAASLIYTFFGFTVHRLISNWRNLWLTALYAGMALVQIGAMYLSGYRGVWYELVVFFLCYALLQRRARILIVGVLVALPFLSQQFYLRFISLFDSEYADSSQLRRIDRISGAIELMKGAPLNGVGWTGSGYVHSDLVQIGANLGVPALLVFVAWYGGLFWQLFRLLKQSDWVGDYARVMFAMLAGLLVNFASEGSIVWIQLMVPIWFLFALVYKLGALAAAEDPMSMSPSESVHTVPS